MMQRDDFENRLGQGLKRWAESGRPTMDLEAMVRERSGASAPTAEPRRIARRPWFRWLAAPAAAAVLMLAAGLTFPVWAGAAANWPLIGPVVTEIILKDAGLTWAYENGLIQGTLAEVTEEGITIRVLGVVADARRTSVIYQILGVPAQGRQEGKPIPAGSEPMGRPAPPPYPWISISAVDGQGTTSWGNSPVETPLGLVGIATAPPLEMPSAEITVSTRINGKDLHLKLQASRTESDKFSSETVVGETKTIEGISITLESVIFTPAETLVKIAVEKPIFWGSMSHGPELELPHIVHQGKKLARTGGGSGVGGKFIFAYPPVKGPLQVVIPWEVKGVAADLLFPLEVGATRSAAGTPITLTAWQQQGNLVRFEWQNPTVPGFVGISDFEVIDARGQAHPLSWRAESSRKQEGTFYRSLETELPPGVTPVAIRAKQYGQLVNGPWVFEVPR